MKHLPIDFAKRTVWTVVLQLPLWVWPLLLAGAVAAGSAAWRLGSIHDRVLASRQAIAQTKERLDQRADRPRRAAAADLISPARAATVNAAVRQLNIPWGELFDAMEAASTKKVGLLELRPEAAAHRLLGVAEARASDDMIAWVERMKAQSLFTSVVVTGHQINEQDRNKPVRFEFTATWRDSRS
jgi:Tfp pilus assembly protein PilN